MHTIILSRWAMHIILKEINTNLTSPLLNFYFKLQVPHLPSLKPYFPLRDINIQGKRAKTVWIKAMYYLSK